MTEPGVSSRRYYLAITIAILGWGFSVPLIEFGLPYISPIPYLAYRFILATAVLTPYAIWKKRDSISELLGHPWMWIIAFSESAGLILQYLGQQQGVPAGLAALLSLCFLLIVPFLSPFILGDLLKRYHLVAIVIGFLGIVMISTEGDLQFFQNRSISLVGILLLLGAAFGYALYIVATSRLTTIEKKEVDIFSLFYLILLLIAINSTIATALFSEFDPIAPEIVIWLLLLVLVSTLIAFFSYFEALKGISANTASVLLLLQVVVPFSVDFFLGRSYGRWISLGIGLILVAMVVVVGVPYYQQKAVQAEMTQ